MSRPTTVTQPVAIRSGKTQLVRLTCELTSPRPPLPVEMKPAVHGRPVPPTKHVWAPKAK